MVGRRGETPLVPPDILPSFKKALACGRGRVRLVRELELPKIDAMVTTLPTNSRESSERSHFSWGRAVWHPLPVGMLVAVLVSLAIDLPVADYARTGKQPRWVSELLENAEPFGHGIGTTLIVIAVLVLDPVRRRTPLPLLAGSLGAGLAANLAKLLVIRFRPRDIEVLPETVWLTFGGVWSLSGGNSSQSFPSAHTATAVGLAVMLSAYYPRGRWFFTVMAILVGMQRIHCSAHFPSDVFAGAIVGWVVAVASLQLASRNSR